MSRDDFNPEAGWTSEGTGWLLVFQTRPNGIDDLPCGSGPGTKGEALRRHFVGSFTRLDEMIGADVRVVERLGSLGCAKIVGPQAACEALKKRVEAEGFARMGKDMPVVLL